MRGLGRLTKNELIKHFAQTGWKVLTIIILAVSLVMPLLIYGVNELVYGDFGETPQSRIDNWKGCCDMTDDDVLRTYYEARIESEDVFLRNGIGSDDWRYNTFYTEYSDTAENVYAIKLIADGVSAEDVCSIFVPKCIDWQYIEGTDSCEYYFTNYDEDGIYQGLGEKVTAETARVKYAEFEAARADLEKQIAECTVETYADGNIERVKSELADAEMTLQAFEMYSEFSDDQAYAHEVAERTVEGKKIVLSIWEAVAGCTRENEGWMINTASYAEFSAENYANSVALDRETYEDVYGDSSDYDAYVKRCTENSQTACDALALLEYSAKNGIQTPEATDASVRTSLKSAVTTVCTLVMFVCIILGATIVAAEYSSGTIRLLLIRPRKRYKILLSKMLCIVIYSLALFIVTSILTTAVTFAVNGIGDAFVPYLVKTGESIVRVPAVLYIAANVAVEILPDLMFVSLALLLSVLMKKMVFAIALPMIIRMSGSVISMITVLLYDKLPFLEWTVLPYLTMSGKLTGPLAQFGQGNIMVELFGPSLGANVGYGAFILLAHTVLFVVLTFISFNKQQIKN